MMIENTPVPPTSPLPMPVQDLKTLPLSSRPAPKTSILPKLIVGGWSAVLTVWAVMQMYRVLNVAGMTPLEWVMLVAFFVNICWITFAFVSATGGFLRTLFAGRPEKTGDLQPGRTAILFPIYNEDVTNVFATVESTARALRGVEGHDFDCFVLSDTTNPDVALREEAAFLRLRDRLGLHSVYYRRRTINHARKSGNIEDFVTRWGGRYDHMIIFDADSYMERDTILTLVARMQADERAGLIQTVPRLVGGETLFARVQQFASRLYGPLLGHGVAWWSGSEGNYWGHNAIIRVRAFAEAAGLPELKGRKPFGGQILSHDFVEAALLRRAGWKVKVASDLGGSYEECPPTIIDLVVRDRRWCQGNLQHLGVLLGARRVSWTNRLHLAIGIMSYLASPLWLFLILTGMALSLQAEFWTPDYFGNEQRLFPRWPVIDSMRALTLFGVTMGILFAPKIYGLIAALLSGEWRREVGPLKVIGGTLAEIVVSILIAPVLMVEQTLAVFSILLGRDSGWSPQQRSAGGYRAGDVMRRFAPTMIFGVVLMGAAFAISPVFAAWLSPAGVGLVLAGPLAAWTGSLKAGQAFRKAGLLVTPEEAGMPLSVQSAIDTREDYCELPASRFADLVADRAARSRRAVLADTHWRLAPHQVHEPLAHALARAETAESPDDLTHILKPAELLALLNHPERFDRAVIAAGGPEPDQPKPASAILPFGGRSQAKPEANVRQVS